MHNFLIIRDVMCVMKCIFCTNSYCFIYLWFNDTICILYLYTYMKNFTKWNDQLENLFSVASKLLEHKAQGVDAADFEKKHNFSWTPCSEIG